MKMNEPMKRRVTDTCRYVAELITRKEPTESEKAQASKFVDRVLQAANDCGEGGFVGSDLTPKFNLSEIDLLNHTLTQLSRRNVLKMEVRYCLREKGG